jgi:hypothetical protein
MSLLDAAGIVTGDIWCSGAFSFDSPLKDLLDSGEYTLEQLLAEDELLQELRGMHPQLIEFLSSEESVAGLIQYVVLPPGASPPPTFASVSSRNNDADRPDAATEELGDNGKNDDNGAAAGNGDISAATESKAKEADKESSPKKEPGTWLQGEDVVEDSIPIQPKTEQEEKDALYVRFPYMACEVICCEIKGILDVLVDGFVPASVEEQMKDRGGKELVNGNKYATNNDQNGDPRGRPILDLLFSMLYESKPGEIDDYRAGYFDKILSVLFRKRPQEMSDYINGGGGKGGEVLMAAMINHLYSHSIMQIVQRLLLPTPQISPQTEGEDQVEEGDDLYGDIMAGADMDGFGFFRCNWSESEVSLDMLLDCLVGNKIAPEIESDGERKLSLYQNASEVLITIIQNSPLTSPTLRSLTEDPVMGRLVQAATSVQEGSTFSHHDSRLTCAMNVLESLILQLGGYGSVGTMVYPDEEEEEEEGDGGVTEVPITGEEPLESTEDEVPQSTQPSGTEEILASSETLVKHLPQMLSSMSGLLTYAGAESWVSPMQFSKSQPQKILGTSRLRIVRLLESLVLLGDPVVDALLCDSDCLEVCLDLFWKFQWCSMLHQSVANLLVHVFEGRNMRSELQTYFLVKCNLLGRLMNSFWEGTEDCIPSSANVSNEEPSQSLMDQKDGMDDVNAISSVVSEKGSADDDDVLPVSDDDVDAAMEQQEASSSDATEEKGYPMNISERQTNVPGIHDGPAHTPPQSFRLGYMGHVIIICQALVHACNSDGKSESPSLAGGAISEELNSELENLVNKFNNENKELTTRAEDVAPEVLERARASESVATEETPSNGPIILAQLVDTHPLNKNWQDFISTILASETAIQSTPLGGFQGGALGMDPLHAHRPGLAEDGAYDDDDGAAPPLPPRGLLVGGDVIDMDDNDLDVAASMMAGLRLHQPDDSGDDRSKDLLSGISSQSSGLPSGGYMFDDPLGDGRFGKFNPNEDDDSSSDEESEKSGNSSGAVGGPIYDNAAENDAPVMDLFAGNFDVFGDKNAGDQNGEWSDFANFDDAFAGSQNTDENFSVEAKTNLDDVFGNVKDHAMLLEELDKPPKVDESSEDFDFTKGQVLSAGPTADEGATPQPEHAVS